MVAGQSTTEAGRTTPAASSAVAVTTLNVDPAGKRPARAMSYGAAALFATASTSPVDGRTATRAAGVVAPATAASAACCTARSRVVRTGVPGAPGSRPSTRAVPAPPTASIRSPGGAGQPVVQRPLQPGDAELVAGPVAGAGLREHLGGGLADPAEQRLGEPGGRAEQPLRGPEHGARQRVDPGLHPVVVGPPQRDDRDERGRLRLPHVGDDVGRP